MTRHRDALLALAFAVYGVAGAFISEVQLTVDRFGPAFEPRWLVALSGLPIALALVWRRSHPRLVAVALFAGFVLPYEVFVVPGWGITPELLPPLAIFGIAAYTRSSRQAIAWALAAAVVFGAVAVYLSQRDAPPFGTFVGIYVFPLAGIVGAFAAGVALRDRAAELDAARERLDQEERASTEAEGLDAARMALAREIHGHLSIHIDAISRHVGAARAALEVGSKVAWVATMRAIQDAASSAMHGLRATLTVLGDDRSGTDAQDGADGRLGSLSALNGLKRGSVHVHLAVDGRLPEPLRGLATLAHRITDDGVELLLAYARGQARVEVSASDDAVKISFGARGVGWWWRARGSVERARLLETAQLSGSVRAPLPWRPELVVTLHARPSARAGRPGPWQQARAFARRVRVPFHPGMRVGVAFVPVVLLTVLGVLEVVSDRKYELSDPARLAGAVLSALPFLWRARAPLTVVTAVTLLLLGRQELGDLGTPAISQNFYLYFGMFVVGAYARSVPAALLGFVIVFGGGLYAISLEGVDYPPDAYVFYSVSLTASALVGVAVRQRVRQAVELDRVRTRLAERRRAAVAAAAAAERMHVARELHDVVGHSVTVMAVQAGAAVALAERDPDGARRAAESVVEYESVVRAELDQLLRALHSADQVPPSRAGLADLAELVERTRRAGLPVRLESDGDLSGVAPWLIATVYRIVQESLTNVRRHAGRAPTSVAIRVDRTLVHVEVRNEPGTATTARPGGGAGVAGMRERTLVHGGKFEAGPTPEGGWSVRAVLPAGDREPAEGPPAAA